MAWLKNEGLKTIDNLIDKVQVEIDQQQKKQQEAFHPWFRAGGQGFIFSSKDYLLTKHISFNFIPHE
jgi:hypothetical protein